MRQKPQQLPTSPWVKSMWAASKPKTNSLIITLYGDSIAPHGGAIRLGDLIEVLERFGVNERLVRTCVFRLSEDGWLVSKRVGRRSVYSLTPNGMRRFQRAFKRVYSEQHHQWDGSWTLVCLPTDADSKISRENLERELSWEGFGKIASNVFGHPSPGLRSLREVLEGLNLSNRVHVLSARSLDVFATLPLRKLVDQSWDLASLENGYRAFADHFAAFDDLSNKPSLSTADCFIVRTLLIHWFRRVTLHDPQIPAELLPEDWPGHYAYELCHRIYQLIYREAETFLAQTVAHQAVPCPNCRLGFFSALADLYE